MKEIQRKYEGKRNSKDLQRKYKGNAKEVQYGTRKKNSRLLVYWQEFFFIDSAAAQFGVAGPRVFL